MTALTAMMALVFGTWLEGNVVQTRDGWVLKSPVGRGSGRSGDENSMMVLEAREEVETQAHQA